MLPLDNLFMTGDFRSTVLDLAKEFRTTQGLPHIHQLGLVVADVEAAAQALEEKGIGPFFIASGRPVFWRERDEERDFHGKMGIAYHHGFELELLEPGTGSDFYRQHLDPEAGICVQHLGFTVDNVDNWAQRLTAAGYPVWVRGRLKAGPMVTEFAYMDTVKDAGLVIEFICWKLMGLRVSPSPAIFRTLGHIEKWTGKRSISL